MSFWDWSTNESANATASGVNIGEGCPPGNLNNSDRTIMAQLRAAFADGLQNFLGGTAELPVANGGTGGTTQAAARAGIGAAASGANSDITGLFGMTTPLHISEGGTGQTTPAAALANLGGIGVNAQSLAANGYVRLSNGFMIQWGFATFAANAGTNVVYPVAFSGFSVAVLSASSTNAGEQDNNPGVVSCTPSGFSAYSSLNGAIGGYWIAVGV